MKGLPKLTQLVNGRASAQNQVFQFPILCSFPCIQLKNDKVPYAYIRQKGTKHLPQISVRLWPEHQLLL